MKEAIAVLVILAMIFGAALGAATGSVWWALAGAIGVICFYFIMLAIGTSPEWFEDSERE
jgi:hypothetical protein